MRKKLNITRPLLQNKNKKRIFLLEQSIVFFSGAVLWQPLFAPCCLFYLFHSNCDSQTFLHVFLSFKRLFSCKSKYKQMKYNPHHHNYYQHHYLHHTHHYHHHRIRESQTHAVARLLFPFFTLTMQIIKQTTGSCLSQLGLLSARLSFCPCLSSVRQQARGISI